MQRQQRLNRELTKIQNAPPSGICVSANDDNFTSLEANIVGPENSPYKTGIFKLEIHIPDKYPISPPSIKFITKIYHPNIDDNGRICLDLIKMPPSGNWRPTIGIEGLLIAIRMLMESPNPEDPLMADIAREFKENKEIYNKKAEEFTMKYAT